MVSSAELQLLNDNSQPENDKDASGGDSPKVRAGLTVQSSVSDPTFSFEMLLNMSTFAPNWFSNTSLKCCCRHTIHILCRSLIRFN